MDLHKEGIENNEYNKNGLKVYEFVETYDSSGFVGKSTPLNGNVVYLGVVGYRVQGGSNTWHTMETARIERRLVNGTMHAYLDYRFWTSHTGTGTITFYILYYDRGDYDTDFKTDASDFA